MIWCEKEGNSSYILYIILPTIYLQTPASNGAAPASPNTPLGLSEVALRAITEKAETLSKGRKKRPMPEGLTAPSVVETWQEQSSYALHKTDKPGVLCLDILPSNQNLVVTGGADKEAIIFDRSSEQVRPLLVTRC